LDEESCYLVFKYIFVFFALGFAHQLKYS
jgi:hypothetical protein